MPLIYFHENIYYAILTPNNKVMYLCSVGDLHELTDDGPVINSIPQYIEDPAGDRISRLNKKRFRKIPYYEARNVLREYLYFDSRLGLYIHKIPLRETIEIFSPFTHSQKILKERSHIFDKHLSSFIKLYDYIRMYTSIKDYEIGIEGSVLLGLHKDDSDLDLLIRGRKIIDVIEAIKNLKSIGIVEDISFEWILNHRRRYHFVPKDTFRKIVSQLPMGFYEGIKVAFLGVRDYHNITLEAEILGKKVKRNIGIAEVQGIVLEDSEIFFHPMIINVKPISFRIIDILKDINIRGKNEKLTIVSFLPNYYMHAHIGRKVFVRGLLQLLEDNSFRILLHFNDNYLENKYTIYPLDF